MSHGGKGSGRRPGDGYANGWDAIWKSAATPDSDLGEVRGDRAAPASTEAESITRGPSEIEQRAADEIKHPSRQGE